MVDREKRGRELRTQRLLVSGQWCNTYNDGIVFLDELLADLGAHFTFGKAKIISSVALVVHQADVTVIAHVNELNNKRKAKRYY